MGFLDLFDERFIKTIDEYAEKKADEIEEKNFKKNCLPVISFDLCYQWAVNMKNNYPQSTGFIISVKDNPDPRNENDKICVIVAVIDENDKAISVDGEKSISTIFHGKTIDTKMIDYLNGKNSIICKIKEIKTI